MKVEIYILNYNGKHLLGKCLPSIREAALKSIYKPKVFIIDNKSSDDSAQFVRDSFPEICFLALKENKVLCAFNDVVKKSSADIAILLNNDLKVETNFIDPLVDVFLKDSNTFLAAAKVYNFDGTSIEDSIIKPSIEWGIVKGISQPEVFDGIYPTFLAGFGAFDRKKFVELGGYDSLYLPGIIEDMDLCFRAWKKGYKCYHQPKSHIFHMGKASFLKRFGNKKLLAISHRNNYSFIWKNIRDRGTLFKNIISTPLRLIYALFTARWEIAWGYAWFIIKIPDVLKARLMEQKKDNQCVLNDKEIFKLFRYDLPDNKNIEKLIGERFDLLASTFPDRIDNNDSRLNAILREIGLTRNKKILDLGCGKGRVSRVLKEAGADIFGIDISEKLLGSTKDIFPGHFLKAQSYDIPFRDNTFDVVVLLEVIEHIPNLKLAFREITRVLKEDGKLIVVDRNKFSLNNRRFMAPNIVIKKYHELKNEWMYPRDFPYREIWFNPRSVCSLFKKYFKDSGCEYILSDAEKQKWWHVIFKLIPQIRYFVLWTGRDKLKESCFPLDCSLESTIKVFGQDSLQVKERVARLPKIINSEYKNGVLNNIFCLRIDADEYSEKSFDRFYPVFQKNKDAVTIFFNINSFKGASDKIIKCKDMGLDIQSHGYYHRTYKDYISNRYNIRKAKEFFLRLGINTNGFASPMGKWNWQLMQALEDEGYEYSSDFSYDYLGLPSYPCLNGKYSRILEIPIFPVAPELFFQKKYVSLKKIIDFYKKAVDELMNCNLPVIIYAHTDVHHSEVVELLEEITDYAIAHKGLQLKNMTEIHNLWKQNYRHDNSLGKKIRIPNYDYLGTEINLGAYKRIKYNLKEALDLDRLILVGDKLTNWRKK